MKALLLFGLVWIASLPGLAQDKPATSIIADTIRPIYNFVEVSPEFPGGDLAMMAFIREKLNYPPDAGLPEGLAIVSFIITTSGEVTDVKILKGLHPTLDLAAVKVVEQFPRWTPGMHGGKVVNVLHKVPVRFSNAPLKTKVKHKK